MAAERAALVADLGDLGEADLSDWPAEDVATLGELLARLNRLGEAREAETESSR